METDPIELRSEDRPIAFYLSHQEGLVLYDFLSRGEDSSDRTYRVEHSAEQVVLWGLHGILESWLTAPLNPDYKDLVESAREALAIDLVE